MTDDDKIVSFEHRIAKKAAEQSAYFSKLSKTGDITLAQVVRMMRAAGLSAKDIAAILSSAAEEIGPSDQV